MWSDLRYRLRSIFLRRTVERELDGELQFHRQQQVEKYIRSGLSPHDAERQAQLEFGPLEQIKDYCRDARGTSQWDISGQDIRQALRGIRKRPGFAVLAIFMLSLGIGATTALFSLTNTVLFRPLPFPKSDRVMILWEYDIHGRYDHNTPSPANFVDWQAQNSTFRDIAAANWTTFNLTGDGEPERVTGLRVTSNFLGVLGTQPAAGRMLSPSDNDEDQPAAVLSYKLWVSHFAKDPNVVGRLIDLNGRSHRVVGVAGPGFQFPGKGADVWTAPGLTKGDLASRGSHYLFVVGRLKDGVALQQARDDMRIIAARLETQYPTTNKDVGVSVTPAREYYAGDIRLALGVLCLAVVALLLIVCANLAHLFLARGAVRRREIAVRAALGAGRTRVIRSLLTECLLLAALAALPGASVAQSVFSFLERLIPDTFPDGTAVGFDWRVLIFTTAVTLVTAMLFSAAPALQTLRVNVNEVLKQSSTRNVFSLAIGRWRGLLVATELALTVMLLVGAGLLLTSYSHLRNLDPGFRPDKVLTIETVLSPAKYTDAARRLAFYNEVLDRTGRLPGVVSAGYVNFPPLTLKGGTFGFFIDGQPRPEPGKYIAAALRVVSPDYLRTIGVPLLRGRFSDEKDGPNAPRVVVINQAMARKFWPEKEDPLGTRLRFGNGGPDQPAYTVIGIVGDVRQMSLDEPPSPEMYLPVTQTHPGGSFFWPRTLVVRTSSNPFRLVPDLRRVVASVDPLQTVAQIRTMNDILDVEVSSRETQTTILATFAISALILASMGLYGVVSYAVSQRTAEIGLRIALGARRSAVIRSVMVRALSWVGVGGAIGIGGSLVMTRAFSALLFNVSPTDPVTFAVVTVLLLSVVTVATFVPAYRAASVDPVSALRQD